MKRTLVPLSSPSEESFCGRVKTGQLLSREGGGRMEGEDEGEGWKWTLLWQNWHSSLPGPLFAPDPSVLSFLSLPLPEPPARSRCVSVIRDALIQNTALCVCWGTQPDASLWEGRGRSQNLQNSFEEHSHQLSSLHPLAPTRPSPLPSHSLCSQT